MAGPRFESNQPGSLTMAAKSVLERAYELAASGRFAHLGQLQQELVREGRAWEVLDGRFFGVRSLIAAARVPQRHGGQDDRPSEL
jgi:hypothetical protein